MSESEGPLEILCSDILFKDKETYMQEVKFLCDMDTKVGPSEQAEHLSTVLDVMVSPLFSLTF